MKENKHDEMRWLISHLRSFLKQLVGSYVCVAVGGALVLIDPLIVRLLIDDVIPNRRVTWLPVVASLFFVAYASRLTFDSIGSMLNFRAMQKMTFRLRLKLLRQLQRLPAEYHDSRPVGDTLHRLQIDVDQVATLSGEVIPNMLRLATTFIFVLATMLFLNYRLAMVVLPFVPVFILVRRRFHDRLRFASDTVQSQSGKVISFLEEHVSSIIQVQLLSCEQREARRFVRLSADAVRAQVKRRRTELFFGKVLYLIIVIGMTAVLCYGGYQVMRGMMTAGSLVAFYGYTLQLFYPLYGVVDIYSKLQRAGASIRRLMEITEAEVTLNDGPTALTLAQESPLAVELKDVSFSYNADRPVLESISLRVNSGERVALAGMSGNGKSTIARLIARLYDARAGTVFVEGFDVRDVQLKSLRSAVVFVPQDPVLFDVTLRENLLYANANASQEELDHVVRVAQLESLIRRLPNGWNEPLGPHGHRLSGGERQRVALARALLQHPRVLILDECTSALDATTEEGLFEGLGDYLQDITTIVISHRPYPIKWANRVVYLDYGLTREEENLDATCSVY